MLSTITRRNNKRAAARPDYLPFHSIADLIAFDDYPEEEYQKLVSTYLLSKHSLVFFSITSLIDCFQVDYLYYTKGFNPTDTAAKFIKNCFIINEEFFKNVTWHGSSTNNEVIALKSTKFAEACAGMNLLKNIIYYKLIIYIIYLQNLCR